MAGLSQGFSPAADEPPAAGCTTLAAEYEWSESEFGPQEEWDPAVEAVVRLLLEATAPMAYCHGAGYAMVYNDQFAALLGAANQYQDGSDLDDHDQNSQNRSVTVPNGRVAASQVGPVGAGSLSCLQIQHRPVVMESGLAGEDVVNRLAKAWM